MSYWFVSNYLENKTFERIYIRYYSRMKRFAREYVVSNEDAENILQDIFMDFWEKREVYLKHANLTAYLFVSVKNKCIDYLRRKVREQKATDRLQKEYILALKINLDSLEALDEGIFEEDDVKGIIYKAINSLPDKCREIFIMSKMQGKKQKDIAEELNISVNTVETQMGIAYKKLKVELKNLYSLLFLFF